MPLPHLEPPPWLYALLGQNFLLRRIHRRLAADLSARLPMGAKLLDVGTGPGYLLRQLAALRPDVRLTGLDLSWQMLGYCRHSLAGHPEGGGPRLVQADAQALPFPAAVFDAALATFTLHIWPDRAQGVREMARILRPGGQGYLYELRREAGWADSRAFAREAGLPPWLVHLIIKALSPQHALDRAELHDILSRAGLRRFALEVVHQLFWRLEFLPPLPPGAKT